MEPIHTKNLIIRPFEKDDLYSLFLLLSNKQVMKYIEEPFGKDKTELFLNENGLIDCPRIYAVTKEKDFVGYVIFHEYDSISFEIGWILLPEYWGKGYSSELTKALIEECQKHNKRVVIECDPQQIATIKIAEKYGFKLTGKRDNLLVYYL